MTLIALSILLGSFLIYIGLIKISIRIEYIFNKFPLLFTHIKNRGKITTSSPIIKITEI